MSADFLNKHNNNSVLDRYYCIANTFNTSSAAATWAIFTFLPYSNVSQLISMQLIHVLTMSPFSLFSNLIAVQWLPQHFAASYLEY